MISVGNRLCDITNVVNMCNNNDQWCGLDTSVLGLLLHLRWHQCGDCDLVSMHTLLPGRVRAREGKERTTTELSSTRDQNVYISGETQTFVSLSCQVIDSRVSGMLPFLTQVEDESRIWRMYEGWRITINGGWTSPCEYGGRVELLRIWGGDTRPEIMLAHRGEFWGLIHQDKTFLLPIMEHFSKCGLPLSIIFSHSLVVCIFPCINLVDPLIQQCNISQFLI